MEAGRHLSTKTAEQWADELLMEMSVNFTGCRAYKIPAGSSEMIGQVAW